MLKSLLRREQGCTHRSTAIQRVLVEDLAGDEEHGRYEIGEHAAPYSNGVPPFAISFCPHAGQGHWAAVADEEGRLTLLNTSKSALEQPCECRAHPRSCCHTCARRPSVRLQLLPAQCGVWPHSPPPCASAVHTRTGSWHAHRNALFDSAWTPHDNRIVTASGDQTCRLWDLNRQGHPELVQVFHGHGGSVKSVSCRPGDRHVFASGGRDGSVNVWDTRAGASVVRIDGAHRLANEASSKRKRGELSRASANSPAQSVSSVVFLQDAANSLATAGATDGAIKLWDLRRPSGGRGRASARSKGGASQPTPVEVTVPHVGASGRPHGIVCMAADRSGSRLLVNSCDSKISTYDTARLSEGVVAQFEGHRVDTFYIKACFSPDGRFILGGSSNDTAYVWDVSRPAAPPIALRGHRGEVTCTP